MKIGTAIVAAALAGVVVAAQSGPVGGDKGPSELSGRTQGKAQRCVGAISATPFRVAESNPHLLLYGEGKTIWASDLGPGCAFPDTGVVNPEVAASFYCKGDFVRAAGLLNLLPGHHCVLGNFVPYRQ